jgi:HAMP domain-containing protein
MTTDNDTEIVVKKFKNDFIGEYEKEVERKKKKPGKLAVRLAVVLLAVLIPMLVMVSLAILRHMSVITNDLVLNEARTTARTAAKAFSNALETAIEAKDITLEEVIHPKYEKIPFFDENNKPIEVEDDRYHTVLSDVVAKYGLVSLQNEIVNRGHGVLFASAINNDGYVPGPNDKHNHKPRGKSTEENRKWDLVNSRQFRIYNKEQEQRDAAQFEGDPKNGIYTKVFTYKRDTGQEAWDVVSPIIVKGEHFGAFRIGVSKDHIEELYRELLVALVVMFGILALIATGTTFYLSWYYINPLTRLSDQVNELSMTLDMDLLHKNIVPPNNTEIGRMAEAVNRLRKSLAAAMARVMAAPRAQTVHLPEPQVNDKTQVGTAK